MMQRFKVVAGSVSAHCCFEASVIDTAKPFEFGGETRFEQICECFDIESAEQIAIALNALEKS